MAGFSHYLAAQLTTHVLIAGQTYTAPAQCYIGLLGADPVDGTVNSELTNTWYTRKAINFTAASNSATENTAQITFDPCTDTADVLYWGIYDTATKNTGNLLLSGAFTTSRHLAEDDVFVINAGDIDLTWD